MKALITGGSGFVGKHLAECLKLSGWEVTVTKLPAEKLCLPDVEIRDADLLNENSLLSLITETEPDGIFHLAAQSSVVLAWKRPAMTVDINIKGTVNLLETARKCEKIPRILMIGSSEEYGLHGDIRNAVSETTPPSPLNIYAATKVCQNMIGKIYAGAYGMDIMMIRAFNHIGPGQAEGFVASDFCKQAAEIEAGIREPVIRVGNLMARRDFTDVRDIVRAYELVMRYGRSGETYNVGSGTAVEAGRILEIVIKSAGIPISAVEDPLKFRPIDTPVIKADITKLKAICDWKPEIPMEKTINDTLDYWRDKIKQN